MKGATRGRVSIMCKDSPQGSRVCVGGRGGGGRRMRLEIQLRSGRRKVKRSANLVYPSLVFEFSEAASHAGNYRDAQQSKGMEEEKEWKVESSVCGLKKNVG
jgi:hypothetical protein